jgi:hypothetical protein
MRLADRTRAVAPFLAMEFASVPRPWRPRATARSSSASANPISALRGRSSVPCTTRSARMARNRRARRVRGRDHDEAMCKFAEERGVWRAIDEIYVGLQDGRARP